EEHETLSDERQALHERPQILPDELKQKVGTFLLLNRDGTTALDTTYYSETPIRVTAVEADTDEGDDAGSDGDDGERRPAATFHIEEGPASPARGGASAPVAAEAAAPGGKALSQ
ncbi:hypothetical protein LTR94_035570, partial [Friedmanniomyces endolithicus]